MPTDIDPLEFAYQWNEAGTLLRVCGCFHLSITNCLEHAATVRKMGYQLRPREEENGSGDTDVYLPSPEQIRIECLKIREKRGIGKNAAFHTIQTDKDFKLGKHYPKRELASRVEISKLIKAHRRKDNYDAQNDW